MTETKQPTEAQRAAAAATKASEVQKDDAKADEKRRADKDLMEKNDPAREQMEARYDDLDRSFSDGVEIEPEVEGIDREKKSGPKSTTVKKKES